MTTDLNLDMVALQEALLGRYSIERQLGRGGMGTVYLARDVALDRPVAIKVLHPTLAASAKSRDAFIREARTAAALSHPHIVPIFAIDNLGDFVCLIMEFIQGETLGARIRHRGPFQAAEAERLIREVGWALGYAHAHGVVHRDITLENILIERGSGRALLADFGLAGPTADEAGSPRFGTPGFLAPEVIRGEAASPQSDLYALGVVGWTALTGKPPFVAESSAQLLAKHLVQPVPALRGQAGGASRRLVEAIERCLQKDASARPADASAFLGLLERAPEPVALAAPLRHWFQRWERIAPIYAFEVIVILNWALAAYSANGFGADMLDALLKQALRIATWLVIPTLTLIGFELFSLRRLLRDGYGIADIRAALPLFAEQISQRNKREGLRPFSSRLILDLTVLGSILTLVCLLVIQPFVLPRTSQFSYLGRLLDNLNSVTGAVSVFCTLGIGVGMVSPGRRLNPRGLYKRTITRFWQSGAATWLARIAGVAQTKRIAMVTLHRPTALVLGLAIEDIWQSLPLALREELGDLPSVARTLQSSANELRGVLDLFETNLREANTDPNEVAALADARQSIAQRHGQVIAMLEQIRLQLLRTLAARQPTAELSRHLEEATVLEKVLMHEIAGHQSIRRLLGMAVDRVTPVQSPRTPVAA